MLVFWECYRPHEVHVRMLEAVPNPDWVARPGSFARSHEAGRSVDVTIASLQEQCPPARGGWAVLTKVPAHYEPYQRSLNRHSSLAIVMRLDDAARCGHAVLG